MTKLQAVSTSSLSGFKTGDITWHHLLGGPNFDFPIDYWIAVLGGNVAEGRVDFLVKWEPNAYCHFHRHLSSSTTLVLEGEHHLLETTATETIHKVRQAGHFARSSGGDLHMENGGAQGTVVLFSMQADDGRLFDVLDKDMNLLTTTTVEDLMLGRFVS